jgi:hypothetical protein
MHPGELLREEILPALDRPKTESKPGPDERSDIGDSNFRLAALPWAALTRLPRMELLAVWNH